MQLPSAHRFLAVYLTLFGYFGDVYAGTVLTNSNAIKNLPGAAVGKGTNTVSPSPRTSPSGSVGHKLPTDTLQVMNFPVRKSLCTATKKAAFVYVLQVISQYLNDTLLFVLIML